MADFGLQIYNASNERLLTVTDSLTKYVGVISFGENSNNGSQVFPALAGGRPFATVFRTSTGVFLWITPLVTFSGTTVTWTFPPYYQTANRAACQIVVGTY
jgi:hypothetical protein